MPSFVEWNRRLKPFFTPELRIVGEIPLSYADIDDIRNGLVDLIQRSNNFTKLTDELDQWPYAYVCLLSGFATYNTNKDYWESFANFIGLDKAKLFNYKWHWLFVYLAEEIRLKTFNFEDLANPYVATIRFHGGIPLYSMNDYFERMVLPAVQRSSLREIPSNRALEYLLKHVVFVDSPVINFFENSGELGESFFAESCRLAKHALANHGEILPTEEVDLPLYVISAFETYLEKTEDETQHWRKPELSAAPYSEDAAVLLLLPEQEINLSYTNHDVFWKIECNELTIPMEIHRKLSRRNANLVITKFSIPIDFSPQNLTISICANSAENNETLELRRWRLAFLSIAEKTPIIAFRERNNNLHPNNNSFPAEPSYLLFPKKCNLVFEGDTRQIGQCDELFGAWQNWKMELWDLTDAWSVQVMEDDTPIGNPVAIQGKVQTPELIDGHPFQFQEENSPTLYTTELPKLSIPLLTSQDISNNIKNWHLHIRSIGNTDPVIDKGYALSHYLKDIKREDNHAILPLASILGEQPLGTFDIEIQGPQNFRSQIRFRYWPRILTIQHKLELKAPTTDNPSQTFFIKLQEGAKCEVQAGGPDVEIESNNIGWKITVPTTESNVLLNLTSKSTAGNIIRMPIMIPMAKLLWGLVHERNMGDLEFNDQIMHHSIDRFHQFKNSAMHIRMYGLGNMINNLCLRLVEINDHETMLQEVKFNRVDFSKDWLRVGLGQFSDTVKAIHTLAHFEFVAKRQGTNNETVTIPIMELSRDLDIKHVSLTHVDDLTWKLIWKEDYPLQHRRVLLNAPWQPWQEPWEFNIPDEAHGELTIRHIALPPSHYDAYFYIAPSFVPERKTLPENISPHRIKLCTAEERLNLLTGESDSKNDAFRNTMEKAIIYDELGEKAPRDDQLSHGAKYLMGITYPPMLIRMLDWMKGKDIDPSIMSFFNKYLFHPTLVNSMLGKFKKNDPNLLTYLRYSNQVKDIYGDSAKLLLNKVDDPSTILTCLHTLKKKKDPDLLKIMVKMMSEERLSVQDAVDFLSQSIEWSLDAVSEMKSSPESDRLIAGLLPKIAQSTNPKDNPKIMDLIIRAIPFEPNQQIFLEYIQVLFAEEYPNVISMILQAMDEGRLTENEAIEIFDEEPLKTLSLLEKEQSSEIIQSWIDFLYEQHPKLGGVASIGDHLQTPFGIAIIDKIESQTHTPLNHIKITNCNELVQCTIEDEKPKLTLLINFDQQTISITDQIKVWQCGACEYMHPEQKKVEAHFKATHGLGGIRMGPLKLPVSFFEDDIHLIDK